MKLGFSQIRDSIEATVGYTYRLVAGSSTARDAFLFGIPGIYSRPHDSDDTLGVEDCVHVESGAERVILAVRNSNGIRRLLDYLGRALDAGETVLTAEDGTSRCHIDARPNGDVIVKADSGGANNCTITWDASTGNVDIETTGTVRVGGAAVTDSAAMYTALKTEYDLHVHTCPPPLGNTGVPTVPMTVAVQSTKLEVM